MAPKDFKSRPARTPKTSAGKRSGWVYFLLGAVTGAVLTTVVYVNEFVPVPLYVAPHKPGSAAPIAAGKRPAATTNAPKPRFEFYTMLPEMEVAVPDTELSPPKSAGAQQPLAAGVNYYLQAGSFRLLEEADKMKANLAFLGLEAGIQTVTINGSDTWHRVRVGPYSDLASLNESRARLRQNNVEAIVLKVRK